MKYSALFSICLTALAITAVANPIAPPTVALSGRGSTVDNLNGSNAIISRLAANEIKEWLATTDAKITFIGKPFDDLAPRSAEDTMVIYCSSRAQNVCGGACTVYNGGATCLNAPDTQCLFANKNVGFCDHGGCTGSCNQFSSCGTRLDGGFCATPGTSSIVVSSA